MSLRIRLAAPKEDHEHLLALHTQNLAEYGDLLNERFHWHNSLNPAGEGWTWLLYEAQSGACVGTTSLFPRRIYVDGKELRVGQVMFFAVNPSHRSLGPAVMLQRATFQPVDSGKLDFCYDCPPHDEGMSTFVRIGMQANCEVRRFVLPLRSDQYLGKRLGSGAWTKPVVSTANLLLRMRGFHHNGHGLEVSDYDGTFGEEFSFLDKRVPTSGLIRGRRSAEVLHWFCYQFPYNPRLLRNGELEKVRVAVARRAGELQGYVIYGAQLDDLVGIGDVFGTDLREVGRPLIEKVVEFARRNKANAVYAYSIPGTDLGRLLESAGFRPRERSARVVAYESPNGGNIKHLNPMQRWAFSQIEFMR